MKEIKNATWIIICRIIQSILSLIITMITSRYLGPSNYGILNYAISVVSFFLPLSLLGLNSILIHEIVTNPYDEGKILGTSFILSLISSVFCFISVLCFLMIANFGEKSTIIVCLLYALILFAESLELIQYWFHAKLKSKYVSIVSLIAYVLVAIYKIIILVNNKDLYWYAISYSFDYILISIALIYIYNNGNNQKFGFSKEIAKKLLKKSKYYIISNMMISIFAQQDKVMLKLMVDDSTVGYYAAAISCVNMSGFVFSAIIDSMRPKIYSSKNNKICFHNNIINLYSIILFISLFQSILFFIFSKYIIIIIYGKSYLPAITLFKIIIWYVPFSYIGGIRDIWLLAEDNQKYLVKINFIGIIMNFVLNIVLIKLYGAIGAAIATLFTQIFINIIVSEIYKEIKINNRFIIKAFNIKRFCNIILSILKKYTEAHNK